MSETTNYGLFVTDDDSTKFLEWRQKMNGLTNSNMVKIDTALASKANNSVEFQGVLANASWVGDTAPYLQTLTIENLTAEQNGIISVDRSASSSQMTTAANAVLSIDSQGDGFLIIKASGTKPTVDIPVVVIMLG